MGIVRLSRIRPRVQQPISSYQLSTFHPTIETQPGAPTLYSAASPGKSDSTAAPHCSPSARCSHPASASSPMAYRQSLPLRPRPPFPTANSTLHYSDTSYSPRWYPTASYTPASSSSSPYDTTPDPRILSREDRCPSPLRSWRR